MEAFLAAFRHNAALPPGLAARGVGGILYVEDFDADEGMRAKPPPGSARAAPGFTEQDLDAARRAGYESGVQVASEEAAKLDSQLRVAALQSLADAVAAARADVRQMAEQRADQLAGLVLAAFQAALPALSAHHASAELIAVMRVLLPGLRCEPALRVRVHPDLAETMREAIGSMAPDLACPDCVEADPARLPADIHVSWTDGAARRDCQTIWDEIARILAPGGPPHAGDEADAA